MHSQRSEGSDTTPAKPKFVPRALSAMGLYLIGDGAAKLLAADHPADQPLVLLLDAGQVIAFLLPRTALCDEGGTFRTPFQGRGETCPVVVPINVLQGEGQQSLQHAQGQHCLDPILA